MYSRCILTLILFKMTRPDGGDRGNRGRLGHFSYTLRLLPRYFTQVFKNLPTDHQCCSVQNQYVSDFPHILDLNTTHEIVLLAKNVICKRNTLYKLLILVEYFVKTTRITPVRSVDSISARKVTYLTF